MQKEIKINKLVGKTWNWLKMNETDLVMPDEFSSCEMEIEIPEKEVVYDKSERSERLDIKSGMGEDIDNLIKSSNIRTDKIYIKPDINLHKPLRIELNYNDENLFNCLEIYAGEGSRGTIIMEYKSNEDSRGIGGIQTKIHAEKNAEIRLVQVQLLGNECIHLNDIGGRCEDGAAIEIEQIILGGGCRYSGCMVDLYGEKSCMNADIAYVGIENQKLDMNYIANHKGKKSKSEINVKGVLDNKAFKLFRGTIDFKRGAAGAVGEENEDVLMISEKARNLTIPIILCEEEDVEGSHGATIGKIDDELLFYMSSRGIDKEEAYYILAKSRINSLCKKIGDKKVADEVEEYISRLERNMKINEKYEREV
ncbi:SufD family Fe-S cluster assembly protein [uncultured Clostridium sp.]|uniref:SufB/SufD family protein n=1 Tax=uncultured Clostridium sp. TaxID=59620 RepID=UPI0025E0DA35|nr:SufD family Fe-S cluster assembly protein [uncultured Clostridium sp.]